MSDSKYQFPDELEALDYLMFRGESDPRTRSPIMAVVVLDGTPTIDQVRHIAECASRNFIRMRQRVVAPLLPLINARWVIDPDFNIEFHVRELALPAPGNQAQLMQLAASIMSTPFDLARPLWEFTLVSGVNDCGGRSAVMMKYHHSIMDGMGAIQTFTELFDFDANAPPKSLSPKPVPEDLDSVELTRRGLINAPTRLIPALGRWLNTGISWGAEVLQQPNTAITELRELMQSTLRVAGPTAAPPSPLLRRRGLARKVDGLEVDLTAFKRAAKHHGCSFNDAYLAAVAAGVRLYHEEMGQPVNEIPIAIPVNVRRDDDPTSGNRWTGARLALPVGETDAAKRMQTIRGRVLECIAEPGALFLGHIASVLNVLPQPLLDSFNQLVASSDIQASNVPMMPQQPYFAGCKTTAYYPIGPLPGVAVMLGLVTLAGRCFVGIHMDTAAITEPARFVACLQRGFDEVINSEPAATPAGKPKSRVTKTTTSAARATARKRAAKPKGKPRQTGTSKAKPAGRPQRKEAGA